MWADVKSILLLMVLLGAGPALAMEPAPSWAKIPDSTPEGPLLGQDFKRVMERLWEDLQRRQAERNAEIVAACREVRFMMGYLRDRVPQQIDEARRQMTAHPKALKSAPSGHRPNFLMLGDLTDTENFLSGAEATLDQICVGNNDYRNDYEGRLKHYKMASMVDALDAINTRYLDPGSRSGLSLATRSFEPRLAKTLESLLIVVVVPE